MLAPGEPAKTPGALRGPPASHKDAGGPISLRASPCPFFPAPSPSCLAHASSAPRRLSSRLGGSFSCAMLGAILGALLLVGCSLGPTAEAPGYEAPAWIDKPPVDSTYLYAVGTYWGSLNPADNEKNAIADATTRLAQAIRTRVQSLQSVKSDEGSVSAQGTALLEADGQVQNAQHLETWRDVDGLRGRSGSVWVLLRVERPK